MLKRLFLFAIVAVIFASCGNQPQKSTNETNDVQEVTEVIKITPTDFDTKAAELVDQEVTMEGTVVHVCSHGGKRMFLVDENSEARIKVEIDGDSDAAFKTEIEGAVVSVVGKVFELRIDEAYLAEWEAEINAAIAEGEEGHEDHEKGVHLGEEGHENSTQHADLERVEEFRSEIAASGTDHLSFYSLSYISHSVLEEAPVVEGEEEGHDHDHEGHDHEGHDHDSHEGHDHD